MKTLQLIFKVFICLLCFFTVEKVWAQNVGISAANGFTPDASAGLDISFTNKGLLVPRVALTATNAAAPITLPVTSLLVYNTATAGTSPNNVTPGYYYWNGAAWTGLSTATSGWALTGNTGVAPGTNFLGTLDLNSVRVKTNKIQRFLVDSLGSVSVGLAPAFTSGSAREKFLVDAGTSAFPTPTGAFNVISGKGYLDSYLQLNIQNTAPTAAASSDIVASNDQATESVNFIDMGINSSTYAGTTATSVTAGPNTAYLYATGSDFSIGNGTAGKSLLFFTGGTGTNERMRIDGTGNVGIGTTAPTEKLEVNGNLDVANSIYVDGAATNTGNKAPGLVFGGQLSGETISSKRTTGTNQYGLDFYTSSTLRMSVNANGNVGIGTGTNTPASKLTVAGNVAPSFDNSFDLGTTGFRWRTVYAANGVSQTSDRRLKTNIKALKYGLKEVLALQPVSYNWKEKPTTGHKIGLIAQDVRKVVPEVVIGDEAKEKLGMNYAELVPVLINAIKEQQKEIADLKKAVQKLLK